MRAACLIALSVAALSACGGSSSSSTVASGDSPGSSAATPRTGATGPAAGATGTVSRSAAPSRAQFIVEADRICGAASTQLDPQQARLNDALKVEQNVDTAAHRAALASALREETGLVRPQLDRLRALKPPAGDGATIAGYIAAVSSEADLTDQFAAAVAANDGAHLTQLASELTQGKATATRLAEGYGFKVCGNSKH